jgi:hypothetical protein
MTKKILLLSMTLGLALSVNAANEPAKTETAAQAAASKKKTTDVSFDDVLVQGKYHFSDEAVTTVENDKVLDALLGVRTDFKDRLKKSAARH